MKVMLLGLPILILVACDNGVEQQSMLAKFQNGRWPVYDSETYLPAVGKVLKKTTTWELVWPNILVTRSESATEGVRVCRTLLNDTEDHHRRECDSQHGKSVSMNTFDLNGRMSGSVFDPGGGQPVQTRKYEYYRSTETFYGYEAGYLKLTALTERWPGRKKYTIWDNADPATPALHVRDYQDSGDGFEFYISTKNGGVRETSQTRIFKRGDQRTKLTYEVSHENPDGLLEITTSDFSSGEGRLEHVYEMHIQHFNIEGVADFVEAGAFIKSAKLVRSKKTSFKPPLA